MNNKTFDKFHFKFQLKTFFFIKIIQKAIRIKDEILKKERGKLKKNTNIKTKSNFNYSNI